VQDPPYPAVPTEELRRWLEGLDPHDEFAPYYASELVDELTRRPEAARYVTALLNHDESLIRMAAVEPATRGLRRSEAAAHARRLLDDADGAVVAEAIDVLTRKGQAPDDHQRVLDKEDSCSSLVRGAVVRHVARTMLPGARELMERRALDASARVRQNVADELDRDGAPWAQALRQRLRDDPDPDVRDAATDPPFG